MLSRTVRSASQQKGAGKAPITQPPAKTIPKPLLAASKPLTKPSSPSLDSAITNVISPTLITKPRKVLFFGTIWPKPNVSAAGVRSLGMMHEMHKWGWQVAWACPEKESTLLPYVKSNPAFRLHRVSLDSTEADTLLREYNPDIVVFDSFFAEEQWSWRVFQHTPNALRVLDSQDFHSLRAYREHAVAEGKLWTDSININHIKFDLQHSILMRELASYHRSDIVLLVSRFERDLLTTTPAFRFPRHKFLMAPFFYDEHTAIHLSSKLKNRVEKQGNKNIVMLGNMGYSPNIDAVKWTKTELWPLIRKKLPDVKLHVFGANITKDLSELTNEAENFVVRGGLDPSRLYTQLSKYRIHLAPLRFGAGIKGKIVDSWIAGVPTVTTPIGKEGLDSPAGLNGWGGSGTATTAQQIVDRLHFLYTNYTAWNKASSLGREIVQRKFMASVTGPVLLQGLEDALAALPTRRSTGDNLIANLMAHSNPYANLAKYLSLKKQISDKGKLSSTNSSSSTENESDSIKSRKV